MLRIVRRLMKLSGEYKGRLKLAIFISIFEGLFIISPVMLVLYTLMKALDSGLGKSDSLFIGSLLVASVLLRALFRRLADGLQSGTGYKIFARERMKLGEHLKRLPMGYFKGDAAGNISAIVTSDIVFIEQHSMNTLSKIVTGYISMTLGSLLMLIIDYRIGIIVVVINILAAFSLQKLNDVVIDQAGRRQAGQAGLVSSVLEYTRGIAVIKAFNMVGVRAGKINKQFKEFRDISIGFEKNFIPSFKRFQRWFSLGISLVIFTASYLCFNGLMNLSFMLVFIVYIFQFFLPFQVLSSAAPMARIMEQGLDRYEAVMNIELIDTDADDISLNEFDVEFEKVSFAYEENTVLKDISFKVPQNSMTALVGRSGCGKTTITNLVARFWDVDEGRVIIGGHNIKEMTCDSLLRHISMVFQDVYLFNDTIINNVRFGKPDATFEEVVEVCRKARCHDFISSLENGYDTIVDEGGSSLSGGEKQRISIARAILKDSPIILLDEATANVDPDNEKYIQQAIDELVKNKTLIVIAHKLSTIKNADQIIVLDKGRIIQTGRHDVLSSVDGLYSEFWKRRTQARSWKISGKKAAEVG